MTVYAAFNGLSGVYELPLEQNDIVVSKNAESSIDGTDNGVMQLLNHRDASITVKFDPELSEGWCHMRIRPPKITVASGNQQVDNGRLIEFMDEGNNRLFGLWRNKVSGDVFIVRRDQNANGGTRIGNSERVYDLDFRWSINTTTGFLYVYVNGTREYTYSGNTAVSESTKVGSLVATRLSGITGESHNLEIGHIIYSDMPTVGGLVHDIPLVNRGQVFGWRGSIKSIGLKGLDDSRYIWADDLNRIARYQVETSDMPALKEGYMVEAVAIAARARSDFGSVSNELAMTSIFSGTIYENDLKSLTEEYRGVHLSFPTDPSTQQRWIPSRIASAVFGVRTR